MIIVKHETIPIQKIISIACRNFMAFDDFRTFKFDEGVNTIIGGNASGKSSLVTVISQALSKHIRTPWGGRWAQHNNSKESLIEMKFLAGGKEHYLRRVMLGETTTDLHLYIEDEDEDIFYRDGEVIDYFKKLKPISTIQGFENSRKDFYFWTNGRTTTVSPMFSKSKHLIKGINQFIPLARSEIVQLCLVGNNVMAQYRNGELRHLSGITGSDAKIIYIIAKIFNIIKEINAGNHSKVILIDEMEVGLDKRKLDGLYDVVKLLAKELDCQFMITSRFANGRPNPIRVRRVNIPNCYIEKNPTNLHQKIKSFVTNYSSNLRWNSILKNQGKNTTKRSFKWNP